MHPAAKLLILEYVRSTIGFLRRQKPADGAENAEEGDQRHHPDESGLEPAFVLAAIHHDLQGAEPQRDQRQADVIDAAAPAVFHPRRILDQNRDQEHREHPDRDVEKEDPAPAGLVGDVAAERRAEHRRNNRGDRRDAEGGAAPCRRKGVQDDGLLVGLQPAAEEALGQPVDDELGQAGRRAAQERAHREHRDADDEIALAAEQVAEPA